MKSILIIALLLWGNLLSAQDAVLLEHSEPDKRDIGTHELSIGAFNLVAFGAADIAYEQILNPYSGWSVEAFFIFLNKENDSEEEPFERNLSLTGKYKYYFGDRYARGFYVHGFGMLSSGEYEERDLFDQTPPNPQDYTDFALGFGIGGKFVARGGFFLDLSTGIGRNLFHEESPTLVGQFNVNLGFRF